MRDRRPFKKYSETLHLPTYDDLMRNKKGKIIKRLTLLKMYSLYIIGQIWVWEERFYLPVSCRTSLWPIVQYLANDQNPVGDDLHDGFIFDHVEMPPNHIDRWNQGFRNSVRTCSPCSALTVIGCENGCSLFGDPWIEYCKDFSQETVINLWWFNQRNS